MPETPRESTICSTIPGTTAIPCQTVLPTPIKRAFEIYCDIPDEAGVIATIATILASNALSIKNIGIVHNREFEEGVLRIEFYDSISCEKAVALLQKHRYIVYER